MEHSKQSFVLYNDLIDVVKKLPPEKVSELFIHILEYANGNDPKTDDILINIAFEPIKQGMERNKAKWAARAKQAQINGSKGGRPITESEPEKPSGLFNNQTEPEKPVSVSVPVPVPVILLEKETKEDIFDSSPKKRHKPDRKFTPPGKIDVADYFESKGYRRDIGEKAFDYYDVAGWVDTQGTKIISWKQKMIAVWFKDENKALELSGKETKPEFRAPWD